MRIKTQPPCRQRASHVPFLRRSTRTTTTEATNTTKQTTKPTRFSTPGSTIPLLRCPKSHRQTRRRHHHRRRHPAPQQQQQSAPAPETTRTHGKGTAAGTTTAAADGEVKEQAARLPVPLEAAGRPLKTPRRAPPPPNKKPRLKWRPLHFLRRRGLVRQLEGHFRTHRLPD